MKLAKDLMHKTPVLTFESTVPDAVEFFTHNKLDFVVVQASADRFHGVITEGILMRMYLRYKSHPDREAVILYRDLFEPVQLINQNEPMSEIIRKVVTAVGNRVFVINEKSEVIGYIKARDILPLIIEKEISSVVPSTPAPEKVQDSSLYLFENFFTQSPFMMHSINPQGEVQMANEILHRVLGYDFGELIGRKVTDLYPPQAKEKVIESLVQIIDKGFHRFVHGQMVHKNGSMVEVEMVSRALTDSTGLRIGTITVSRPTDMKYLLDCLPTI